MDSGTSAPATAKPARVRKSADERRDEIIAAALRHFAEGGYHGTSTEAIAADAGISQPYLFRLFKTKRDLFVACQEASHNRILESFRAAAEGVPPESRLEAMGHAYAELLQDRERLRFQMQSYAAGSDPVIQARVRDDYLSLIRWVSEATGAGPEEIWRFFGNGMLLNVIAALDLPADNREEAWTAITGWC